MVLDGTTARERRFGRDSADEGPRGDQAVDAQDEGLDDKDGDGDAQDEYLEIEAVGRRGGRPLPSFLEKR